MSLGDHSETSSVNFRFNDGLKRKPLLKPLQFGEDGSVLTVFNFGRFEWKPLRGLNGENGKDEPHMVCRKKSIS